MRRIFTVDRYGRCVMAKWHETRIGQWVCATIITVVLAAAIGWLTLLAADTLPVVLP